MLRIEKVLGDPQHPEFLKVVVCLKLFYGDTFPEDTEAAFNELLWFYYRGETPEKPKARIVPLFDFDEDAPYIASAFLDSYYMDILDVDQHIHWWQFMALFIALPESTQMMQRMCDRSLDTSKMKGEQRKYYEARKKAVALKTVKKQQGGTLEERKQAKQQRLDELYAEAQRKQAEEEKEDGEAKQQADPE